MTAPSTRPKPLVPRAVSIEAIAALFLERQYLVRPRGRRLSSKRLVDFVSSVGGLQLDSINVVTRAHYLTVLSRFGCYDPSSLDRLVYRRRVLFEYWAHAACLIARPDLAAWRRIMLEYGHQGRGWPAWPKRIDHLLADVEKAIRGRGPMGSADFDGPPRSLAGAGWWNWKPTTRALDHLWMSGRTMVHSRQHFHKRFDLAERVFPEVNGTEAMPLDEFRRWHLRRSLSALGAATETDLRMYLTFPRATHLDRKDTLRQLVASGEVIEVPVEHSGPGRPQRWFLLAADLPAIQRAGRKRRASVGTALLSPFDSFLWHRDRTRRLFGFDYAIEVYTPGHRRKHGYYSLPILHEGQLVGRVDTKTHRDTGLLELRHVHLEPWVIKSGEPPVARWGPIVLGHLIEGLVDAANDLARFVGVDRVVVQRVTPSRLKSMIKERFG